MSNQPKIGDKVNIGGSIGKITELTTKYVKVEGSFRLPKMGMSVLNPEPWTARFDPEQFTSNKWSVLDMNWNMSKERIKSSY